MKKFLILSTLILSLLACSGSKNYSKDGVPTIFYEANTRGFFLAIKVENQVLYTSNERDFKEYSNKNIIFDFEGSDIKSVAYFYSKFGSVSSHYLQIIKNKLPWWLKFLKD